MLRSKTWVPAVAVLTAFLFALCVTLVFADPTLEDLDGDGIANGSDNCQMEAGPKSNSGCPVPDTPVPPDNKGEGESDDTGTSDTTDTSNSTTNQVIVSPTEPAPPVPTQTPTRVPPVFLSDDYLQAQTFCAVSLKKDEPGVLVYVDRNTASAQHIYLSDTTMVELLGLDDTGQWLKVTVQYKSGNTPGYVAYDPSLKDKLRPNANCAAVPPFTASGVSPAPSNDAIIAACPDKLDISTIPEFEKSVIAHAQGGCEALTAYMDRGKTFRARAQFNTDLAARFNTAGVDCSAQMPAIITVANQLPVDKQAEYAANVSDMCVHPASIMPSTSGANVTEGQIDTCLKQGETYPDASTVSSVKNTLDSFEVTVPLDPTTQQPNCDPLIMLNLIRGYFPEQTGLFETLLECHGQDTTLNMALSDMLTLIGAGVNFTMLKGNEPLCEILNSPDIETAIKEKLPFYTDEQIAADVKETLGWDIIDINGSVAPVCPQVSKVMLEAYLVYGPPDDIKAAPDMKTACQLIEDFINFGRFDVIHTPEPEGPTITPRPIIITPSGNVTPEPVLDGTPADTPVIPPTESTSPNIPVIGTAISVPSTTTRRPSKLPKSLQEIYTWLAKQGVEINNDGRPVALYSLDDSASTETQTDIYVNRYDATTGPFEGANDPVLSDCKASMLSIREAFYKADVYVYIRTSTNCQRPIAGQNPYTEDTPALEVVVFNPDGSMDLHETMLPGFEPLGDTPQILEYDTPLGMQYYIVFTALYGQKISVYHIKFPESFPGNPSDTSVGNIVNPVRILDNAISPSIDVAGEALYYIDTTTGHVMSLSLPLITNCFDKTGDALNDCYKLYETKDVSHNSTLTSGLTAEQECIQVAASPDSRNTAGASHIYMLCQPVGHTDLSRVYLYVKDAILTLADEPYFAPGAVKALTPGPGGTWIGFEAVDGIYLAALNTNGHIAETPVFLQSDLGQASDLYWVPPLPEQRHSSQ